jgi:hypothetical protein
MRMVISTKSALDGRVSRIVKFQYVYLSYDSPRTSWPWPVL